MRLPFMLMAFIFLLGCKKNVELKTEAAEGNKQIEEGCFDCDCNILGEAILDEPRWKTYLENNLQPDSNQLDTIPSGTYTAIIQFEIETDGSIDNTTILKDPGYNLGIWAMDIMKSYKAQSLIPDFNVKTYRRQPITWIIEE